MRAQHTFPGATDRWLHRLLTWAPGQTDMIKTVALVLMVTDHTGLLLAGNNEVMRLLGRGCFRGLTLSGTKTHVKQRFLPLTPLLMVSDDLWSPVLPA